MDDLLKQHWLLAKNSHYGKPDKNYTNGPVTFEIREVFYLNGIEWRITATADTFVIATRTSVKGEPMLDTDIIQVSKPL